LLNGRPRHVTQRFFTTEANQEHHSRLHALERQPRPDKGHWAGIVCDVEDLVRLLRCCHDLFTPLFFSNKHCEMADHYPIWPQSLAAKEVAMADPGANSDVLGLTAQIVSAHVSNNPVSPEALPLLIQEVYRTLSDIGRVPPQLERPQPAVQPKKSVFSDYIVCLEDGKKLKMLKRHLKSTYNLTPEQYRERWGPAVTYPMVAPNYAKHRSALAKKIGLGTRPRARH